MSALKTRSLLRPAAQNLSLSLAEANSFQFGAVSTYEPSTASDDNSSTILSPMRCRFDCESISSVTAWKSGQRILRSALTTGSVYSQESYSYQTPVCVDTRRFAIALESPDIEDLWPFITSPLSSSTGSFVHNLRNADDITLSSVNFVLETALDVPSPTSPTLLDTTVAMLNEITTSDEQNAPVLLPVVSAAPAHENEIAADISARSLENKVEPGKGNLPLPTRGLARQISHIFSSPSRYRIPSVPDRPAEIVSLEPYRDAAPVVKRRRTLRKRAPSTPRKQTLRDQKASLLAQGLSTILPQEPPIPPLPTITISPLAVSFEVVKDDTDMSEFGLQSPTSYDDWETIGIAF